MDRLADVAQGLNAGHAEAARVAIVGGGWAGLACAATLSEAGFSVCVFEAARQLGGRARRVDINGYTLDNGQHLLLGAYRETLRLMRLCGADPERLLLRRPLELNYPADGIRLRLPHLPAPFHLAAGLLLARGMPLAEKWAAVRFIRALQACNYRLAEDTSVAELLRRYDQGNTLLRVLWQPLCLAALNTAPEHASAQIFANVLRDALGGTAENSDLLLPRTDLSRIFPDAAAHFITEHGGEIRLSARVRQIERYGQDLVINGERFAHAVVSSGPQHAGALLRDHEEVRPTASMLDTYRYEPIATAYLAYPEALRAGFPMLGMRGPFGQWVFDRGQLDGQEGIAACVLSAQGDWEKLDDETLAKALHSEVQETLGRALPEPTWQRIIRERRATFSCRPCLARPATKTGLPGLWLAGDYVCADYPATLEGAVRSGVVAAHGILGMFLGHPTS